MPTRKLRKEIRIGRIPRVATWSPFRRCGSSKLSVIAQGGCIPLPKLGNRQHSHAFAGPPGISSPLQFQPKPDELESSCSASPCGSIRECSGFSPLFVGNRHSSCLKWVGCLRIRKDRDVSRPLASNRSLSTSVGRGHSTRRSEEHLRLAHPAGVPSPVGHKKLLSVAQSRFRSKPSPFVAGQPLQVSRFRVCLVR